MSRLDNNVAFRQYLCVAQICLWVITFRKNSGLICALKHNFKRMKRLHTLFVSIFSTPVASTVPLSVVILLALFCGGCGTTRFRESHIMQARDQKGNIAYYRLRISADAQLAKTTYRAGLYDAEALDALMGETSSELAGGDTSDRELARERKDAINQIASQYYGALAKTNILQTQIAELARRLGQALISPYDAAASATPQGQFKPQRKFAIIFSANASVVEEAIADFVEAKETEDTVNSAVAGLKRDAYIEATVEKQQVDGNKKVLKKLGEDAAALGPPGAGDQTYADKVRSLFNTLASVTPK